MVRWVIFLVSAAIYFSLHNGSRKTTIIRYAAGTTIALFSLRALLLTYATYSLWSRTLPSKYLLPPYQPISYFLQYSFIHFFASFLLSIGVGLAVCVTLLFLNYRRTHLLLPGDIALLLIGMTLAQWPIDLVYITALFIGGILLILLQRYIIRTEEQIIFGAHILVWMPVFLLFGNGLIVFLGLQALVMPT